MERPTITIDGKTYECPRPKGGMWRKLLEYDKNHNEVFAEDFIEKRCEFLAEVYGNGLTADKLLDELYLDEIIADYRAVTKYLIEQLTPKLEAVEKNASAGDATAR